MASKADTPWGKAEVLEEARVQQRGGGKSFASVVQLLETDKGEVLVRIAYTTDGIARRGPVTLRLRDLGRLQASLGAGSRLAQVLGWEGEA